MVGNVYVQFREEEQAASAFRSLTGKYYEGRPIIIEFSPVTDFREATCWQYEENKCKHGGYCNLMHLKRISRELRRRLFGRYRRSRSRSRSRSPHRHRIHEDCSHGGPGIRRDYYRESQSMRRRRNSPRHTREHRERRNRRPVRDVSEERRARIEQWNREKENGDKVETFENNQNDEGSHNGEMQNEFGRHPQISQQEYNN